jgi:HEAT repeat protein
MPVGPSLQELQQQALLELQQLRESRAARQWNLERLFLVTIEMSETELRAALRSRSDDLRFFAAYVVGERMLEWQSELLALLEDNHDGVRLAARRALIILSFLALNPEEAAKIRSSQRSQERTPLEKLNAPVDFGPRSGATRAERTEAAQGWTKWWTERGYRQETVDRILVPATRKFPTPRSHSEWLAQALTQDDPEARKRATDYCRRAKGPDHTEALALAISRQSGDERQQLRDALGLRMYRMTDQTLGEYLEDEDAEIRRAAIVGLTMKDSITHMDQIIEMLLDPEPTVARAAYAALRHLSGKNYGPALQSTEAERIMAASRWRKWWEEKHPQGR